MARRTGERNAGSATVDVGEEEYTDLLSGQAVGGKVKLGSYGVMVLTQGTE